VTILDSLSYEQFAELPLVDGHVHVWKGVDPNDLWRLVEERGAERFVAMAISLINGGTLNADLLRTKRALPTRTYAFGALDYGDAAGRGGRLAPHHLVEQGQALWEAGFDGIKMLEGKPPWYIGLPDRLSGPFFAPFFNWAQGQQVPLVLHIGDAPRLWDPARAEIERWSYVGETYPTLEEQYADLRSLVQQYPRLRLILAHLAFFWDDLPRATKFLADHPGVMFDLTPGVEGYFLMSRDPSQSRAFFVAQQDRLIFGSDLGAGRLLDPDAANKISMTYPGAWLVRAFLETEWTMTVPEDSSGLMGLFAGQTLRGIGLPRSVLEKIYRLNVERLVGKAPRDLNHLGAEG